MLNILKDLRVWWHTRRVGDLTLQIRRCNRALDYLADEEVRDDSEEFVSIQRELEVLQNKRKEHFHKLCVLNPYSIFYSC